MIPLLGAPNSPHSQAPIEDALGHLEAQGDAGPSDSLPRQRFAKSETETMGCFLNKPEGIHFAGFCWMINDDYGHKLGFGAQLCSPTFFCPMKIPSCLSHCIPLLFIYIYLCVCVYPCIPYSVISYIIPVVTGC